MSPLAMVLTLLGAAVVMFALNRPRMDVVAVIMMVALPMTGVISVPEALAGLSDPNIVLIAALFVIGEALVRTGVAQRLGDWLTERAGASEAKLIFLLMVIVAGVGSFMSSTGVVAIFIPIVLRIARNARIPAGRLMMPLSVAALISGMMTLIATAPNLVVHAELVRQGHAGFTFFSFAPFGLPILALAIIYMLAARRFLAPGAREPESERAALAHWIKEYDLAGRERRFRLRAGSSLAGKRLDTLELRASAGVNVIAIERGAGYRRRLIHPRADTVLEGGDTLLLNLRAEDFDAGGLAGDKGLVELAPTGRWFADTAQEVGMAQLIVPPTSRLIGQTLTGARFRTTYDLSVIGMKHGTTPVPAHVIEEPLRAGDTLLAVGPWRAIRKLHDERRDLVLLDLPAESDEAVPARHRGNVPLDVEKRDGRRCGLHGYAASAIGSTGAPVSGSRCFSSAALRMGNFL
jgi:di/tricarboxylate transporter